MYVCVCVCVCVCVPVSGSGSLSLDSVCLQVVMSVQLLVSTVDMSYCLQSCHISTSSSSLTYDIHSNLVQTVKQLSRDIDVFWQVIHTFIILKTKMLKCSKSDHSCPLFLF